MRHAAAARISSGLIDRLIRCRELRARPRGYKEFGAGTFFSRDGSGLIEGGFEVFEVFEGFAGVGGIGLPVFRERWV